MAIKVKGARDILGSLPKAPSTTQYDPAKQTAGYLRRLEGAGVDVEKANDPRNLVERALNLRPDQNVLFDIFEVINRPQQALFNAFKAGQEGNDIGQAFLKGLSGKEEVRFKEILTNFGMSEENPITNILGFAGDVLLDPVDWALLPVTASIAGIDTVADAARIVKTQGLSDKVLTAAKAAKDIKISSADDIVEITKKGLAAKKKIDAGQTTQKATKEYARFQKLQGIIENSVKGEKYLTTGSALGITARGAKEGIIKVAGLTDEAVSRGLMAIDKYNGIKFKDESVRSFKDLVLERGNNLESFTLGYYNLKNSLAGTFDIASKLPSKVLTAIRRASGSQSYTERALGEVSQKVDKLVRDAAEKGIGGTDIQSVRKNLFNFFEWFYRKTPKKMTLDEVLTAGAPLNQEMFNRLIKTLNSVGYDISNKFVGAGVIEEGTGALRRYTLDESLTKNIAGFIKKNTEVRNTDFVQSLFYTKESRDFLEALGKDEAFMKLFNDVSPEMEKMQKALTIFQDQAKLEGFTEAGYARHVYNRAFDSLQELAKKGDEVATGVEKTLEGIKYGNVKAVSERKWQMSALEANAIVRDNILAKLNDPKIELSEKARKVLSDLSSQDLFVESIQASMDDWIAEIPKLVKNATVIDEVLVKSIIKKSDDGVFVIAPDDIIHINYKGPSEALPRGYVKIEVPELRKKLAELSRVSDSPELAKLVKELGQKGALSKAGVAIDQHVYSMLNYIQEPKQLTPMLQIVDKMNNVFKQTKLLSAGFHVRNIVGNFTNAVLVGMPPQQVVRYFGKADDVIKRGTAAIDKVLAGGALSAADRQAYNLFKRFVDEGFTNISSEVYDIGADVIGKNVDLFTARGLKEKVDGLLQLNAKANEFTDLRYRLGLFMYAAENPQLARNIGVETPGDVVRRALFDPKATSRAERETIKRIVPFYTFAKKNLAYQMRNIFDNPVQYNRLQKSVRGLWDIEGIDVNDIESYKKENFWIPIPGLTKDGKYTAIKTNLPVGDLAEWFENPLVKGISSLTPMVRAPFELATGVQTFTGRPIQDFPGQRGYVFPNIPRNLEYAIGQTGFDVPVAAVRNVGKTAATLLGFSEQEASLAGALPSAFSAGDLERAERGRAYDELNRVRDLYAYYRQELGDIPTVSEIENKNQNQIKIRSRMDNLLK